MYVCLYVWLPAFLRSTCDVVIGEFDVEQVDSWFRRSVLQDIVILVHVNVHLFAVEIHSVTSLH